MGRLLTRMQTTKALKLATCPHCEIPIIRHDAKRKTVCFTCGLAFRNARYVTIRANLDFVMPKPYRLTEYEKRGPFT